VSKNIRMDLTSLASVASIFVLAIACAVPDIQVYEKPDGTVIVESSQAEATVTAVDARARTVTLKRRFHDEKTFKAGESIANFDQIQVGDKVEAVVVEEFAVALVPGGAPEMVGEATSVGLAPLGSKPGVVMVNTVAMTAEITGIDAHDHRVTIVLPDGTAKNVKVSKHIDLTNIALGDSVYIQLTEAVALEVVKPD
jgi:hypothetical protein